MKPEPAPLCTVRVFPAVEVETMNIIGVLTGIGAIALVLLVVASPAMAAGWQNQTANQNSAGTCPMQADCSGAGITHMHRFQNTTAAGSDLPSSFGDGSGNPENAYQYRFEHAVRFNPGPGTDEGSDSAGNGPNSGDAAGMPSGTCKGDCTRNQERDRAQLQDGSCGNCLRT